LGAELSLRRLEFLLYWLEPPKPDRGEWYWFDILMEITIFVEVTVAIAVYGFLWTHGQL
jgi:hypothetical protein